jgi:hypothetical protein
MRHITALILSILLFVLFVNGLKAQEVHFFSDGTDNTYYDQGVVDVANLGESAFEYTYPPVSPQWNDKVPCVTTAFKGASSLKFNYTSSPSGNWNVTIHRNDWSSADLSGMDSISMYVYTQTELSNTSLPLIGVKAVNKSGTGDVVSKYYQLADYNQTIAASTWTRVKLPLSLIFDDADNDQLDFTQVKAVVFNQSETDNSSRLIYIDEITAFKSIDIVPPITELELAGYDSHVELNWTIPMSDLSYRIYASFDQGQNYELRGETTEDYYLDFVPESAKNSSISYRVVAFYQEKESDPTEKSTEVKDFSDEELLDLVQEYTFRYFWEGVHQQTGMTLERSNGNGTTVASGASGMGLMAMIIAHERDYRSREDIKDRILLILDFLENCDRHHGAWSHWYNAETLKTLPFSTKDNGGDIVETAYVAQALIALRNYFMGSDNKSNQIREKASLLWSQIEWDWYKQDDQNVLSWHWSPDYNFEMELKVRGWNEAVVTYIMAASSSDYSISKEVYEQGWANSGGMLNNNEYYGFEINLSPEWGGPMFYIHYSHLGINPKGLKDKYADYWTEHVNTSKIHHAYAVANPNGHKNYSDKCWGLTASDDPYDYTAHSPMTNDNGTISPTAALASMPYTPEESMKALKYFYRERGSELFGKYGFYDAFNDNLDWVQESYIGIDQGPIVIMIENHRTGLLWENVMKDTEVQNGLNKLEIQYQVTSVPKELKLKIGKMMVFPNPNNGKFVLSIENTFEQKNDFKFQLYRTDGKLIMSKKLKILKSTAIINLPDLPNGTYLVQLSNHEISYEAKLMLQN